MTQSVKSPCAKAWKFPLAPQATLRLQTSLQSRWACAKALSRRLPKIPFHRPAQKSCKHRRRHGQHQRIVLCFCPYRPHGKHDTQCNKRIYDVFYEPLCDFLSTFIFSLRFDFNAVLLHNIAENKSGDTGLSYTRNILPTRSSIEIWPPFQYFRQHTNYRPQQCLRVYSLPLVL